MTDHGDPTSVQVYDFFAGCGGASCGFQSAGMEVAFALDHDPDARASFEANFPEAHFEFADIRTVSVEAIRSRMGTGLSCPVLFSGCAPCQPYTRQNTIRPEFGLDEGDAPVRYLVGTPKGRLTRLEKTFLDLPWQEVRQAVNVKLLAEDGELYILVRSDPGCTSRRFAPVSLRRSPAQPESDTDHMLRHSDPAHHARGRHALVEGAPDAFAADLAARAKGAGKPSTETSGRPAGKLHHRKIPETGPCPSVWRIRSDTHGPRR